MLPLLWLIPTLPLAGFLTLAMGRRHLSRRGVAVIGTGSVALSALIAILIAIDFIIARPEGLAFQQEAWVWIAIAGFSPRIGFYLDALSLVMVLVVTIISFLIHLYSTEFMIGDESYARFFAYMNLFVGSMCILVLADNLLFLYLGWEGVGLCSYLLIGFWYRDPVNGRAARKAFIVTRIGDTAMAIGLFLLFTHLGTLDIQPLMQRVAQQWPEGSELAILAAALLLVGAVGKSAQLPLQTWLPDAMAGPTPVSALIHAATMVTAGVYLIARTHVLFSLAPPVQLAVAIIGALTLLLAGFSALAQKDIKRVLAYSTISQLGYMFLALGVGAWSAAIFHLMTHAFFKALLFLSAGVVIMSLHEEHDIFRMGGLRKKLPVAFWTFLIGSASLAALPLVTAGFYSKDLILWQAWSSAGGNPWLWAAGWGGAILTGLYIFRVVFLVFFGEARSATPPETRRPGLRITIPLTVLAALSLVGGWIETPHFLGNLTLFSSFVQHALPPAQVVLDGKNDETVLELLGIAASLGSIVLAYLLFLRYPAFLHGLMLVPALARIRTFWHFGWGFDRFYEFLFVRPYLWLAYANRHDVIDNIYRMAISFTLRGLQKVGRHDMIDNIYSGLAKLCLFLYRALSATQSGQVRRYAAAIAAGSVGIIFIGIFA
ncbi:NADH-quinone oxidoreductase subunit L [Nitrosospira briensis]|uniref:NADH-quinone oxidoreductase subunit L n=1 Tax=Nitrosospira briensis TaxID=35799 RepID=UPI0008EDECAF|nr:NADH-quinone oxidoreductase subunit L [Nitrosospira briensis]SFN71740.1 NADH dehydrogenase subunit L [Nitrosospira briensis]